MKKIWIHIFAAAIFSIGWIGVNFMLKGGTAAYFWVGWAVSLIIVVPAYWWWHRYFTRIFNQKDDEKP